MNKIELDGNLSVPLVDRLAEHFRKRIFTGELRRGSLLPKNNSIPGISHVTVIAAYKKLAAEGLTRSVRAKGTVVTADVEHSSYAFATICSNSIFNHALLNAFQHLARYEGNAPQVFFVDKTMKTLAQAEASISTAFRREVEEGRVRGVMVTMHNHFPGLMQWLESRRIPVVGIYSSDTTLHRIMGNHRKNVDEAVQALKAKGCPKIHFFCTGDYAGSHEQSPTFSLMTDPTVVLHSIDSFSGDRIESISEEINRQVTAALEVETSAPGLIFTDDFVTIKVLMRLRECGWRVPEDVPMLAITHESQMTNLMTGVDLLLIDQKELIQAGCRLIEEVLTVHPQNQIVKIVDSRYQPTHMEFERSGI